MKPRLCLIAGVDQSGTIGDKGDLPWELKTDLRHFRELTTGHVVICGRVTYESIIARTSRPLRNRTMIVVSTTMPHQSDGEVFTQVSFEAALLVAEEFEAITHPDDGMIFVIGGARIYEAALPHVDRLEITLVSAHTDGDTKIDLETWTQGFGLDRAVVHSASKGNDFVFTFKTYTRRST